MTHQPSPFYHTSGLLHGAVKKLLGMPALRELASMPDEDLRRLVGNNVDPEAHENAKALLLAKEVIQSTDPYFSKNERS